MFPDELDLRVIGPYKFKTLTTFRQFSDSGLPNTIVPDFFETDLISIPRWLWWLIPPHGRAAKASVPHDYHYINQDITRKEADLLYREGCAHLKVKPWRKSVMYFFLRVTGWYYWDKRTKELKQ